MNSPVLKYTLVVVIIAIFPSIVSADIYKYTDKHGRVILTDKPKHSGYKRLVKTWKGWVEQKPGVSFRDFAKNREKYSKTIKYMANRYRLPDALLHAVITAESSYDANAVSRAGAVGLMQLMPETAKRYGVKNRRNPYDNINGGTHYLRDLIRMFDNNLVLALAAYNAGENAVKEYGNQIPPYRETRTYVNKVIRYYKKYKKTMS
jgi:soluble lytic murein transglycosylase-like protein